jgi:hypothetical protein
MVLRVYFSLWLFGMIAALGFYLTGNLNPFWRVLFGFLTFGTLFMGFLSIIPTVVFHGAPKEH